MMKISRISTIFVLLSGISNILIASPTSKEEALQKAQQFYISNVKNGLRSSVDLHLVYTDTVKNAQESTGFYIFNAGANDGFIMVSGDNVAKPILAYSDQGTFPKGKIPGNLQYWLEFYHKEMQSVMENKVIQSVQKTTNLKKTSLRLAHSAVEPLLGGIKWDQYYPFNIFCPYSEDYSENTVVGCVATAMAQVMKYHEWPVKGTGENTIKYYETDRTYKEYTVKFGETTYPWKDMFNSYDSTLTLAQDSAVALLSYHCGVAVNMVYATVWQGGSSAYSNDIGIAMVNYFGYDPDMRYLQRNYYDQSTWSDMLMDELDAGRPVLYGGGSNSGGHEFVCDGYDSYGLFHMNWGWSGLGNGYYVISVVDPIMVINGESSGGFVFDQDAIIGIRKDDGIYNPAPSYEMNLYNKSITSNKPGLKSVSTDTFSVNYGYVNFGYNTFNGRIGAALYKDDAFQKCLAVEDSCVVYSYFGENDHQFDSLSLAGFTNGDYRLYAVYQPDSSTSWFKFKDKTSLSNYMNVSIRGDSATFSNPYNGPEFVQTSAIKAKREVYQNKTSSFSVSVKNNGPEFGSYMALYVCSTTDSTQVQYTGDVLTIIAKDETKTLEFSGNLTVDSGIYNAYVVYDSLCNYGYSYKIVDRAGFAPLQFKVNYYPAPELTISKRLEIVGGDSIYQNKKFSLNVEFTNVGSAYDDWVDLRLYPELTGYIQGQTGSANIFVDSLSTKAFTLTGTFDVNPGKYRLGVFYNSKDGWDKVKPTDPTQSVYTWFIPIKVLANPTGIGKVSTKGLRIGRNPVDESIDIISDENVLQADIYDINGRILGRFSNLMTLPAGNLKKGVYFLRVTTNNGIKNIRFIK